jgi:hypothetical protein
MFSELTITDILGSEIIDNNTPLIIISASPSSLIQYLTVVKTIDSNKIDSNKIDSNEIDSNKIYKLNHESLIKDLSFTIDTTDKFDITNFIPVGDICSSTKIKHIVLANKYILPTTNKFKKVGTLSGLTFWAGYLKRKEKESRTIGLFVTEDDVAPKYRVPVLPKSYLVKMDFPNDTVAGNEFNILNIKSDGLWVILRHKFTKGNNNFKLMGLNGKYLSSDSGELRLKDGNSSGHNISYNVQGELVMGDRCITTNDNKDVSLEKCSNKSGQKWVPYNGNYISMLDNKFNTCLSVGDKNRVITKKCNPRAEPEWTKQNIDNVDHVNYTWPKIKGKTVVLVEKDDPWFLNKDIVGSIKYIPHKFPKGVAYDKPIRGAFKSKYKKTPTDFIRGYSYAEQSQNIEGFDDKDSDSFSVLLLVLIIAILIIVKLGYFGNRLHIR